jgi:hypothetical protein
MIKKKMSGICKCLLDKEKNFFIFLECAGFFLRFFAYSDKRGLNKRVVKGTLRAEKTCAFRGTFPRLRGGRLCAFLLMWTFAILIAY